MKIGIDFDNVLANSTSVYLELFNKLVSTNYKLNDIRDYNICKILPNKYDNLVRRLWQDKFIWDNIQPLSDSQTYTSLLAKKHELYVITASTPSVIDWKFNWLKKNYPFLKEENFIVIRDKQLINIDVLIDDYEINLINGNYKGILLNKPWNEDFNESEYNISRANNWEEIYQIINCLE